MTFNYAPGPALVFLARVVEFGHVFAGFHRRECFLALSGKNRLAVGVAFDVATLSAALTHHYGQQLNNVVLQALPRATDVIAIAARQLARAGVDCTIKPEHAAPLYLRNKVAMTIEERKVHHASKATA